MIGSRQTLRRRPWLVHLLVSCLLATSIAAWAHAAEHAGEPALAGACSTCDWAKHSPAISETAPALLVHSLMHVAAPPAPIRPDVLAQRAPAVGRAPPAA